ncbi:MAG: caspase family protein [Anaerolineae bacterium]|nr:caspase family protein [Anaerolineae bacterium]
MDKYNNAYAVVIGISKYQNYTDLPKSVAQDAHDIASILASPLYCGYNKNRISVLINEKATAQAIRDNVKTIAATANPDSTVIFYFSGHGFKSESDETYDYLAPYDFDEANLSSTALSSHDLTNFLKVLDSRRTVVILDACYAAGIGQLKAGVPQKSQLKAGLKERTYEILAQGKGRIILASCRENETSLALPDMPNSIFTHFLLNALKGDALDRNDELVHIMDVFHYIATHVPERASRFHEHQQHPVMKAYIEDNFPIALRLGGKFSKQKSKNELVLDEGRELDLTHLREVIASHFNLEEIEIICADIQTKLYTSGINLSVNLENVGGNSKEMKILNLINYLNNRGYLNFLVVEVQTRRPGRL